MPTEQQVQDAIKENAGSNAEKFIGLNDRFSASGLDSMDVFSVLAALEVLTGIKVPDADVDKLTTINSMSDYYYARS